MLTRSSVLESLNPSAFLLAYFASEDLAVSCLRAAGSIRQQVQKPPLLAAGQRLDTLPPFSAFPSRTSRRAVSTAFSLIPRSAFRALFDRPDSVVTTLWAIWIILIVTCGLVILCRLSENCGIFYQFHIELMMCPISLWRISDSSSPRWRVATQLMAWAIS